MNRFIAGICAAGTLLVAGCATPPDGSQIDRLPESSAPPVALTDEQKRELAELNARLLSEQNAAQQADLARDALRARSPELYWGLHYGSGPHWRHGGWFWAGSHWAWRPRWSLDLWGPWGPWPH